MIRTPDEQDVSDTGGAVEVGLDFEEFARSRQAQRAVRRICCAVTGTWPRT
ncbi:hypothetical protein [Streptomyces sp. NPDC050982]|uniref:hypothetical protein n=1 Tax=Streptomyces sp. NPDC050982 TaxID=3154746 RepID=UPI0033EF0E7A